MTVQVHDLKYVSLPVGWDATYLKNFALADGITFDRVVGEIETNLALFNTEAAWYDDFVAITDEVEVEYPQGNLTVEDHTEYTPAKPQRTDFTGHMLPVLEKDLGYRFTLDFLKKGRFSRVQGSIRAGVDAFRQHREYLVVKRALQRADDSGASKGLGSSGYSPGFATAAANTAVDYIPPRHAGKTFTSAHEHYLGYAAANLATGIAAMIAHLREHGHVPPYELWISENDAATVGALTGFVYVTPVTQIAGTSSNQVTGVSAVQDVPYYLGSYKECYVRVIPRFPQYYYWLGKPYGFGDMRNPFRMRFDPRWGPEGVLLLAQDPSYPLKGAYLFEAKGVGVGEDRTNGVAMFIDAGAAWSDATVT